MDSVIPYSRFQQLQEYVGWSARDEARVQRAGKVLISHIPAIIEDFYTAVENCPDTARVREAAGVPIDSLKRTLCAWLEQLFTGPYDEAFVASRFRVGVRHVEIGLPQVYTNAALSRIRQNVFRLLKELCPDEAVDLMGPLNRALDLDLAIIEEAYRAEFLARQQRIERLATIGQISGGIAHELRNPLNAMRTSVYYLLNAANPTPEKRAEHLQRIDRQVAIADNVISALSDFSKLPVPKLSPVALRESIQQVLESTPVPQAVRVSVEYPESLPRVLADDRQIRIVLGNLIRNACDAMPDGGPLRIDAEQRDGRVWIRVCDAGTGIAPEELKRIMEPLYSTKSRGIGLGLAISRAILQKHNSDLMATSEPARGSTFAFDLSAASE